MIETKGRGGRRPGAGRKPLPVEERKVSIRIWLKPAEARLVIERGGSEFVRRMIFGGGAP